MSKQGLLKIILIFSFFLSFVISLFLWKVNYLGIRQEYEKNMPFYEVLVTSLGNIRYTLAAYLWIRTEFYIHYSGNVAINQLTELVYYTRFITMLDPNFVEAYDFGAYQLAFFLNLPSEGIKFISEGIKNNPDYWKLYFTAGMIYSQKFKKYKEALPYFLNSEKLINDPITYKKYSYYKIDDATKGQLYRFISKCLYEQRDYNGALEYYKKSERYIKIKAPLYYEIIKQLYGR